MPSMRVMAAGLATVLTLGASPAVVASAAPGPRNVVDDVPIKPSDFSTPTQITNPVSPISALHQVISLGDDGGAPARVEFTILPATKTIRWQGGTTEVVVAQFIAFTDGRIVEVAYDWLAQDDAGNLWYFGEDVSNFKRGKLANHEGSWIAGADGPPGMLMPADPQVGDVFHSENIPGLVYERDRVLSTTATVDGPRGPVDGVIKVREEPMEGGFEFKYWAPGYGEFRALVPGEEDVSVVFALPIDAQVGAVPASLTDLRTGARDASELAAAGDWTALAGAIETLRSDWTAYGAADRPVIPAAFVQAVDDALTDLESGTDAQQAEAAQLAAIALELAALDVVTTHGNVDDVARIDALTRRQAIETASGPRAAAASTSALIAAIEART